MKIRRSSILKDFGQWKLTRYGLESDDYGSSAYLIDKDWILITTGHTLEMHMAEKDWVNMRDLMNAIKYVRANPNYNKKNATKT